MHIKVKMGLSRPWRRAATVSASWQKRSIHVCSEFAPHGLPGLIDPELGQQSGNAVHRGEQFFDDGFAFGMEQVVHGDAGDLRVAGCCYPGLAQRGLGSPIVAEGGLDAANSQQQHGMTWEFLETLLQDFELLFFVALGESAIPPVRFLLLGQLEITAGQCILWRPGWRGRALRCAARWA